MRGSPVSVLLHEIALAADPGAWRALGFEVAVDGRAQVGTVSIALTDAGEGRSFTGWTLAGLERSDLDGLATDVVEAAPDREAPAGTHPNGVTRLDHVVAFTSDLDRTVATLEAAGLDLRRIREEPTPAGAPRQAFFRLGEVILEVVQQPDTVDGFDLSAPARLWGLAFVCEDLDGLAERFGGVVGEPRAAVQPGRRIVTARRDAGAGVPVAFMSPAT